MNVWHGRKLVIPGRDPEAERRTGDVWVAEVATPSGLEPYVRLAIWEEGDQGEDVCLFLTPREAQELANELGTAGLAVMSRGRREPPGDPLGE